MQQASRDVELHVTSSDQSTIVCAGRAADADQVASPWYPVEFCSPLERWPNTFLRHGFAANVITVAELSKLKAWPDAVTDFVDGLPIDEHCPASWLRDLRSISACISMVVHLTSDIASNRTPEIKNLRRRRTAYASYPTPPAIARVIAAYVHAHLPRSAWERVILDPTIEGAPLLLECARLFHNREGIRLIGIDKSPAAVGASQRMFDRGSALFPAALLKPELCLGDSLALMRKLGPIDALVNNPPWGERQKNGVQRFPGNADPFCHFVELGLKLLRPGAPFGLILPGQAISAPTARSLRVRLGADCEIDCVATLPKHCFPRATVRVVVVLGRKRGGIHSTKLATVFNFPLGQLNRASELPKITIMPREALSTGEGRPWLSCVTLGERFEPKSAIVALQDFAKVTSGIAPYCHGKGRPPQSTQVVARQPFTFTTAEQGATPVLRGRDVQPFHCRSPSEFILLGPHLAFECGHAQQLLKSRIFLREICSRNGALVASPAPAGAAPRYGLFCIALPDNVSPLALCAILNSNAAARFVRTTCDGFFKESFNRIRIGDVRRFPVPERLLFDCAWVERIERHCRRLLVESSIFRRARLKSVIDTLVERAFV